VSLEDIVVLPRMQSASWSILAVMVIASTLVVSIQFAFSVLAGGVISIGSFWLSQRDVVRMAANITASPTLEDRQAQARQGQKGYLLKFWLRLIIVGIGLFLLIKFKLVNIFGLILGLSTVVLGIAFVALGAAGRYVFRGRR